MPDGSLIAGGWFTQAGGQPAGLVARWDGTDWSALGLGLDAGTCQALALLPNGDVIAGGSFLKADEQPAWGVARWNGQDWNKVGEHTLGGGVSEWFHPTNHVTTVRAIAAMPDGSFVVGGNFLKADGVSAPGIARWDGSEWSSLGTGMNAPVEALAVLPNGDLIAGGVFSSAGGISTSGIARWDGVQWHSLGTGLFSGSVWSMVVREQGDLIIGGTFTEVDGVQANYVARWDPVTEEFSALGTGMRLSVSTTVFGLAATPSGSVYAAGQFSSAGGSSLAENAARFDCLLDCVADFNGDGVLDFFDVQEFLDLFAANDPAADLTGEGVFDFFDVQAFLAVFAAGCP